MFSFISIPYSTMQQMEKDIKKTLYQFFIQIDGNLSESTGEHCVKCARIWVFADPYFPVNRSNHRFCRFDILYM